MSQSPLHRRLTALTLTACVAALVPATFEREADAGVRIRIRKTDGGDTGKLVKATVKQWTSELATCYRDMAEEDLHFQHRMSVAATVDANGALVDPKIEGKVSDEYVQECMDFVFASMRFGGLENQTVSFQLRFNMH